MIALRWVLTMVLVGLMPSTQQTSSPQSPRKAQPVPASCPVTNRPAYPFIPPGHYPTELPKNYFWIGTDKLWTEVGGDMVWEWLPRQPGHEQELQPLSRKLFWGSLNYNYRVEPVPSLKVTGRRLDGPAPPLLSRETNALLEPNGAMLSGVYAPAPGCWEITGDYKGARLSFVVWVAETHQLAAGQ